MKMEMKSVNDPFFRERFEQDLKSAAEHLCGEPSFAEAMQYSLAAGGKRLRPMMLFGACEMLGGDLEKAMPFSLAIEMIHTYSLIHDDLPALDNDSLRRGKPTSHVAFGEAQAILAGDGLLNGAAEIMLTACLSGNETDRTAKLRAAQSIMKAAGTDGMLLGQWLDVGAGTEVLKAEQLERMHLCKTGALFSAALEAGAILAGASETEIDRLKRYALCFGMVFQLTDDILDVTGDPARMGKSAGKDARKNKKTYVTFFGLEQTREMAQEWTEKAALALDAFSDGQKDWLIRLVRGLMDRQN